MASRTSGRWLKTRTVVPAVLGAFLEGAFIGCVGILRVGVPRSRGGGSAHRADRHADPIRRTPWQPQCVPDARPHRDPHTSTPGGVVTLSGADATHES